LNQSNVKIGTILLVKGAKISNYEGLSINVQENLRYLMDPIDLKEFKLLRTWYKSKDFKPKKIKKAIKV
jgi:hypothetical protein